MTRKPRLSLGRLVPAVALAVGALVPYALAAAAEKNQWTLASEDTEVRIAVVADRPVIQRLGTPGDSHNWLSRPINVPLADKSATGGGEAALTWRFESGSLDKPTGTLTLVFAHGNPALRHRQFFQAAPGHGAVRQWAEIENRSAVAATVAVPPCLAMTGLAPGGPAALWRVNRGGNDASKQGGTFTEPLAKDLRKSLPLGPGGANPIPWMAVQVGQQRGLYVGWEYSGSGQLQAVAGSEGSTVDMRFVMSEMQLPIPAGQTLWLPPAFVGCYRGDVDDGSYCLHRFYLERLRPPMPKDCPDPLLTCNVFFNGENEKKLMTHLKLAQEFGFEAFVVDAIWFPGDWTKYKGPWIWDLKRFPDGGKPFRNFCQRHRMKFGLWCAWGGNGDQAEAVTRQIVADNKLSYFKHDLDGLIPGNGYPGTMSYYRVQESLRKSFPDLILEDCSGGGTIKDYGAMSRAQYVVTTDVLSALPDRMGIYDSTFAFPPMVLQNYTWLVHDKPGPYLWRSGMMGAWVIDTPPLPNEAESIKRATAVYKSWIRPILRDCRVHHILPRPDGKRWDGIFYWGPKLNKGIVFIFRPQSDDARQVVKLKGLQPLRRYWVWCEDGSIRPGERTGKDLMESGLQCSLPERNSSDLIFVQDAVLGKPLS
jgi:hypothetical protein